MEENYVFEKKSSPSDIMPEGDYEVILERMERRTIPSGKEKLSLMFRVRKDVEGQEYGNKCLFEDIWQEKDHPQFFNRKRLNQLLGTQDFKDGTVFESINDIIRNMIDARLIVHVVKEFDDYRGEEVNRIAWYRSSKYKPKMLEELKKDAVVVESEDEGLPF